MDRANSHTKSYNIPRSFEAMYINIKYELRAWVTCDFIEKFTGGAEEQIIDEAPRRIEDLEGIGTSSVFARGDPNDQIYEEDENFSRNCLSAETNRRSPHLPKATSMRVRCVLCYNPRRYILWRNRASDNLCCPEHFVPL